MDQELSDRIISILSTTFHSLLFSAAFVTASQQVLRIQDVMPFQVILPEKLP